MAAAIERRDRGVGSRDFGQSAYARRRDRAARLRLLYTVAGRQEDAARPILDAAPATQAFLSKELEGLGLWLDAEGRPMRFAARLRRSPR